MEVTTRTKSAFSPIAANEEAIHLSPLTLTEPVKPRPRSAPLLCTPTMKETPRDSMLASKLGFLKDESDSENESEGSDDSIECLLREFSQSTLNETSPSTGSMDTDDNRHNSMPFVLHNISIDSAITEDSPQRAIENNDAIFLSNIERKRKRYPADEDKPKISLRKQKIDTEMPEAKRKPIEPSLATAQSHNN